MLAGDHVRRYRHRLCAHRAWPRPRDFDVWIANARALAARGSTPRSHRSTDGRLTEQAGLHRQACSPTRGKEAPTGRHQGPGRLATSSRADGSAPIPAFWRQRPVIFPTRRSGSSRWTNRSEWRRRISDTLRARAHAGIEAAGCPPRARTASTAFAARLGISRQRWGCRSRCSPEKGTARSYPTMSAQHPTR